MAIEIRPAIPTDQDALASLDTVAAVNPQRIGEIRRWIAASECFVALYGGETAAYGVFNYHFFHAGMIEMVMVGADFRKMGIGGALLRHFSEMCTTPKIWTSTNLSNQPMQNLIAGAGFIASGYIHNLDEHDPELIFVKVLT